MLYLLFSPNANLFVHCLTGREYLTKLKVLDLEDSNLMGSVQPIIGTLNRLKSLSLRYNNLNDSLSIEGNL